ncbi:MAG: alginate lyase family protein [Chthoniobacteraceae bacterium]
MWQLYRMAMLWTVKKDQRAAEKGIEILENYAKNHKRWIGVEPGFMRGDCMNAVVAAEILRSTYPGWTEQNTADIKRYFSEMWWESYVGKDNTGAGSHLWTANQGTISLKVAMEVAIFCDDRVRFNMCLSAYLTDPLTGLQNSIPNGEVGDTGRDTGHWTAECIDDGWICQMAWVQGIDIFAQASYRIVAISEFLAQNQLFCGEVIKENAPYIPYGCSYEFYPQVSHFEDFRGQDFFAVIDDYARLKSLPAPFTRQLLQHENYQPIYTLDNSVETKPIGTTWVQPVSVPVTTLRSRDIGPARGSTSHTGDGWSLDSDSKRMEDAYHLAYVEAQGDWTFVARVVENGALAVTERLEPTPQVHAVWFEAREGGSTVHWSHGQHSYGWPWDMKYYWAPRCPMWLKLVRRGIFIQAWQSADGMNWAPAANVRFDGLADKLYVGLAACVAPAKFDHVAFGSVPGSLPTAPTEVEAVSHFDHAQIRWKPGANTVFCDVLRSESSGGPLVKVGERITTNVFNDPIERDRSYYYLISPANYSGRGPDSEKVALH